MAKSDKLYGDYREARARARAQRREDRQKLRALKAEAKAQRLRELEEARRRKAEERAKDDALRARESKGQGRAAR